MEANPPRVGRKHECLEANPPRVGRKRECLEANGVTRMLPRFALPGADNREYQVDGA
jgi:hypothetical protein